MFLVINLLKAMVIKFRLFNEYFIPLIPFISRLFLMALDVDNVRVFSYLLNLEWFGVIEGVAYTFYLNFLDTFLLSTDLLEFE